MKEYFFFMTIFFIILLYPNFCFLTSALKPYFQFAS